MAQSVAPSGDHSAYRAVARTMLGGLLTSIGVMAVGLLLSASRGRREVSRVLPLDQVVTSMVRGQPAAVLDAGILLLFATPLVAVLVALVAFVRQGDRVFAALTAVLLLLLGVGFAVALR